MEKAPKIMIVCAALVALMMVVPCLPTAAAEENEKPVIINLNSAK